jgi:hypothetical protein
MQSRIHRPISPSLSNARRSSARPCDPSDSFRHFYQRYGNTVFRVIALKHQSTTYWFECHHDFSGTLQCTCSSGLVREQSIMIFSVLRNMHVLRRIILSSNTHQSNFHVMNMEHNERTVTQSQYFKRLSYQL